MLVQLLPHPYNFSPVGAFALLAGAYSTDRRLLVLPLLVLLVSDILNGFYALLVMGFVYAGFFAASLVGRGLLLPRRTPLRVLGACVAGALVFYFISNSGVWLAFSTSNLESAAVTNLYPRTLAGYVECMYNGLPFLRTTLLGQSGLWWPAVYGRV